MTSAKLRQAERMHAAGTSVTEIADVLASAGPRSTGTCTGGERVMDRIELGAVLGDFFEDSKGPSHDQLDQAFVRTGLAGSDPAPGGRTPQGSPLGKTKRIRQVVALLRADGAFSPALDGYAGAEKIERLRGAFAKLGSTLDPTGALRPTVDNLTGTQLTEALQAYVNRINLNPDDAPLQIGKELDEATARHVLEERTGGYPVGGPAGSFPVALAQVHCRGLRSTVVGRRRAALESRPGRAGRERVAAATQPPSRTPSSPATERPRLCTLPWVESSHEPSDGGPGVHWSRAVWRFPSPTTAQPWSRERGAPERMRAD